MSELPKTRQSLLLALGNQNESAWQEFLAVYERALLRFCVGKGLQEADAQDVLQEVLNAVLQRVPSWDHDRGKGSFRGWLFQVARNIAVDAIRTRAKRLATGDTRVNELLKQVPLPEPEASEFDLEYRKSLFDWASRQVKTEVQELTWKSFCLTASAKLRTRSISMDKAKFFTPSGKELTEAQVRQRLGEREPVLLTTVVPKDFQFFSRLLNPKAILMVEKVE